MKYKKIFKKLSDSFKFNYNYCNSEEIVTLIGRNGLNFEISIELNHMSLAIEKSGVRENYAASKVFTNEEKGIINDIINSIYDTDKKLELLCKFFDNYRKKLNSEALKNL